MKKQKVQPQDPKRTTKIAIIVGVAIIATAIGVSYNLDMADLKGQKFGNDLAGIQSDLHNETANFDGNLTMYEKAQISKNQMLNITDLHLARMQSILTRYDSLSPPDSFTASLQLFRLSTQTQIDSDNLIKQWIQTGDNSTRAKSDQLLQESFQYEMNALQSYGRAKAGASQ